MGNNKTEFVHCSFEPVNKFWPRIPEQRCPEENDTIPRICAAKTICGALRAIPQAGEVINRMQELEVPIYIHAYFFECSDIMETEDVERYVPDAADTGEVWLLKVPDSIRHELLSLNEVSIFDTDDIFGKGMCVIEDVEYYVTEEHRCGDNWKNLLFRLMNCKNDDTEMLPETLEELKNLKISYRTFMSNLRDEDVKALLEIREKQLKLKEILNRRGDDNGIL
ncbi:hypothetical protein [Blautia producta]|uniref:hypothetical protein n=1 Tax=Blautia producta TaxID=33035 RepID=UPI0035627A5A